MLCILCGKILQAQRIKSSQSPERKLRCCRTGLCLFFAHFSRQPCIFNRKEREGDAKFAKNNALCGIIRGIPNLRNLQSD